MNDMIFCDLDDCSMIAVRPIYNGLIPDVNDEIIIYIDIYIVKERTFDFDNNSVRIYCSKIT